MGTEALMKLLGSITAGVLPAGDAVVVLGAGDAVVVLGAAG